MIITQWAHVTETLEEIVPQSILNAELVTTWNIVYFYSCGWYIDRAELITHYKHTYMNHFNVNFPLISFQVS